MEGGASSATPGPACALTLDWTPSWGFSWFHLVGAEIPQALRRVHMSSQAGLGGRALSQGPTYGWGRGGVQS